MEHTEGQRRGEDQRVAAERIHRNHHREDHHDHQGGRRGHHNRGEDLVRSLVRIAVEEKVEVWKDRER